MTDIRYLSPLFVKQSGSQKIRHKGRGHGTMIARGHSINHEGPSHLFKDWSGTHNHHIDCPTPSPNTKHLSLSHFYYLFKRLFCKQWGHIEFTRPLFKINKIMQWETVNNSVYDLSNETLIIKNTYKYCTARKLKPVIETISIYVLFCIVFVLKIRRRFIVN